MSGGGSKSDSSGGSSTTVSIPGFLEPFIRDSTSTAGRALSGLESLLGLTGGTPQPMTELSSVRGPGGQPVFVDPSQGAFVDASGAVIAPFQDGVVPGLVEGNNNPVEVRGNDVVGVGSSGINELFTRTPVTGGGGGTAQDLVAGFTDAQQAAQALGVERALFGDLFSSGQNAAANLAANGVDTSALANLEAFGFDPSVISTLRGAAQNGSLAGTSTLQDAAAGGPVAGADALSSLMGQGVDTSALSSLMGPGINPTTSETLTSTASGDYLYGGDGFNAAVDAAVRAAQPGILSTFGSAGAGAATGGLAQEAVGRAAVDAFANQYARERQNQLGAANTLGQLGLSDLNRQGGLASNIAGLGLQGTGLQADIANRLGGLDLSSGAQQIDAANILGQLGLNQTAQQMNAASTLGGLNLAGSGQDLAQANALTNALQSSAGSQLDASRLIPGLATADVDLLQQIGGLQQAQAQNELDAPRNALLQLLTAALGGTPIASLLGQDTTSNQESRGAFLGFEAPAGVL